ncbi:ABC transporter substrate-binding protein [Acetobacterium bakii]|uniref:Solute-binding protein family 5 domain-containing protein n=1 Tax=Acetobacterium bakii TaxID=52689 RepID=A0A0L6TYG9_9FIRM|nr:ABC transporter substrate-binding protein [Acetobacterium bakii]KNZ41127.1 hypothetical protein AKG39_13705 [Acetobacterium bakii]
MKRKVLSVVIVVLSVLLLFTGCSASAKTGSDEPKDLIIGAGRTFWLGEGSNVYVHGSSNVWESLVRFDNEMNPIMCLAESMSPSDDGLTWTIKLKKDIKFHDGSTLNSEVAILNLDRLYHFNTVKKAYDPAYESVGEFGKITNMSVVDDHTFTVTHAEPIPDFIERLVYENGAMFAPSSFNENKAIVFPYGTGPYKYKEYNEQTQVLYLEKFADYHLGEPKLDTVEFKNIADPTTRLAALQSGEIDVISDVGGILPQQAAQIESDSNLVLEEQLVSTVHYYFMNTSEGKVFSNEKLRDALSLSIDRNTIVNKILLGYGKPSMSVLSSATKDWTVDCKYEFNIEEAKKLKTEAVGGEIPTPIILLNSSLLGRWPYQDIAIAIQAQLKEVGIDATIETVDSATWSQRLKEGTYDIAPQPFTVSSGEPNFFFVRNALSTGSNNVSRNYGINDADLDGLIQKVAIEPNEKKRKDYYSQIQKLVSDKNYIIPIWDDITLYATNKKVKNYALDVTFRPDLYVVDIQE